MDAQKGVASRHFLSRHLGSLPSPRRRPGAIVTRAPRTTTDLPLPKLLPASKQAHGLQGTSGVSNAATGPQTL
jgi:hypothetical protein